MSVLFPKDRLCYKAKNNYVALEEKNLPNNDTHKHTNAYKHTHERARVHTHTVLRWAIADRWRKQSVSADKLNNRSVLFLPPLSLCFLQISYFTCLPSFLAQGSLFLFMRVWHTLLMPMYLLPVPVTDQFWWLKLHQLAQGDTKRKPAW